MGQKKEKTKQLLQKIKEARQTGKKVVLEDTTDVDTDQQADPRGNANKDFFLKHSHEDDDLKDWIVDDDEIDDYYGDVSNRELESVLDLFKRPHNSDEPNDLSNTPKIPKLMPTANLTTRNAKCDEAFNVDMSEHLQTDSVLNSILENMSSNEAFGEELPLELENGPTFKPLSTTIPKLCDLLDSEGKVFFYWFDAVEAKAPFQKSQPSHTNVYLFGKVFLPAGKLYNCSVVIEDIPRQLYFHPIKKVGDWEDKLIDEVSSFLKNHNVSTFRREIVTKNFAYSSIDSKATIFDKDNYLKVTYSSKFPPLPGTEFSGDYFDHVYGATNSCLEHFILTTKMKGPQWLSLSNCKQSGKLETWCDLQLKVESLSDVLVVTDSKQLNNLPTNVDYTKMFLTVHMERKVGPEAAMKTAEKNVSIICLRFSSTENNSLQRYIGINAECYSKESVNRAKTLRLADQIQISNNESQLLNWFLALITKINPEFIIGYKIYDVTLKNLLSRLKILGREDYSKLGRYKIATQIKKLPLNFIDKLPWGRCFVDLNAMIKELIPSLSNQSIYDVGKKLVANYHYDVDVKTKLSFCEDQSSAALQSIGLNGVISSLMSDTELFDNLCDSLQLLPLFLQLTSICGFILSKCFNSGRADRNEYLLLHAFVENDSIFPDKNFKPKTTTGNKPKYEGGLVLEPKKGYYRNYILLMDFNSLYPSIIQEYNVCFSTVARTTENIDQSEPNDVLSLSVPIGDKTGILSKEIKKLVDRRKDIKRMIASEKNPQNLQQLDIRQKALKLTANSMYGCLGFVGSRFQASHIAALITAHGRNILRKTKELVESLGYEIVYGDTDSLMINTHCNEIAVVKDIGREIKNKVSRCYHHLEFEMDGIYKPFLLLRKKKYAALNVKTNENNEISTKVEIKGLDMIRHDWSTLAKTCGNTILGMLLSEQSYDQLLTNVLTHLAELKEQIFNNEIPLSHFEIDKCLIRHPSQYANDKALPHVLVAKRLIQKGRSIHVGDTIRYVICADGTTNSTMQRAYHISEMEQSDLKIDYNYYIRNQVFSVISRLVECIDGLTSQDIARALGISDFKTSSHHISATPASFSDSSGQNINSLEQVLFGKLNRDSANVKPIKVKCSNQSCGYFNEEVDFMGIVRVDTKCEDGTASYSSGLKCACCHSDYNVANICNYVDQLIHHCVTTYYSGFVSCNSPTCSFTCRDVFTVGFLKSPKCPTCLYGELEEEFNEKQLYLQLIYLKNLFDADHFRMTLPNRGVPPIECYIGDHKAQLTHVHSRINQFLQQNSYHIINLEELSCYV